MIMRLHCLMWFFCRKNNCIHKCKKLLDLLVEHVRTVRIADSSILSICFDFFILHLKRNHVFSDDSEMIFIISEKLDQILNGEIKVLQKWSGNS